VRDGVCPYDKLVFVGQRQGKRGHPNFPGAALRGSGSQDQRRIDLPSIAAVAMITENRGARGSPDPV
jgi:hypothetical protein